MYYWHHAVITQLRSWKNLCQKEGDDSIKIHEKSRISGI